MTWVAKHGTTQLMKKTFSAASKTVQCHSEACLQTGSIANSCRSNICHDLFISTSHSIDKYKN